MNARPLSPHFHSSCLCCRRTLLTRKCFCKVRAWRPDSAFLVCDELPHPQAADLELMNDQAVDRASLQREVLYRQASDRHGSDRQAPDGHGPDADRRQRRGSPRKRELCTCLGVGHLRPLSFHFTLLAPRVQSARCWRSRSWHGKLVGKWIWMGAAPPPRSLSRSRGRSDASRIRRPPPSSSDTSRPTGRSSSAGSWKSG